MQREIACAKTTSTTASDAPVIWGKVFDDVTQNGDSREGGGSKKKINICLVSRRSVVLISFKIAIKT